MCLYLYTDICIQGWDLNHQPRKSKSFLYPSLIKLNASQLFSALKIKARSIKQWKWLFNCFYCPWLVGENLKGAVHLHKNENASTYMTEVTL